MTLNLGELLVLLCLLSSATIVFGRGLSNERDLRFNPFCEELLLCDSWPAYQAVNKSQIPNSNNIVQACVNSFGAIRAIDATQTCIPSTENPISLNAATNVIGSSVKISGTTNTVSSTGLSQPMSVVQPYLTLNFIICLNGIYPSQSRRAEEAGGPGEEPQDQNQRQLQTIYAYIGEIRMFAGNFAPYGWAFCQGQTLPISQYQAVFSLLGTFYGGDGTSTFALPDLRGRVPLSFGQGPGLSSYTLGQESGTESVTATVATLPAHTHTISTVTGTLTLN